jgi:hypothetical protein
MKLELLTNATVIEDAIRFAEGRVKNDADIRNEERGDAIAIIEEEYISRNHVF